MKKEKSLVSLFLGGDVTVYGLHKPTELAHSFYSVLVPISVVMAFSPVFHFINSPDVFSLSSSGLISALLVLSSVYLFMKVSFSADMIPRG